MCPLQLCSARNYPCVHYSYLVPAIILISITEMQCPPAIIHVSISVNLCVHNNEVVPAKSCELNIAEKAENGLLELWRRLQPQVIIYNSGFMLYQILLYLLPLYSFTFSGYIKLCYICFHYICIHYIEFCDSRFCYINFHYIYQNPSSPKLKHQWWNILQF